MLSHMRNYTVCNLHMEVTIHSVAMGIWGITLGRSLPDQRWNESGGRDGRPGLPHKYLGIYLSSM